MGISQEQERVRAGLIGGDVDELEEDKLEEDEWMVVSSNISHFAFLTFITAAKEASDLQQGWECC